MAEKENVEGMLSPYRVLDLTDEKGLLCGKVLGDLGADVIKIERLGGDPARNVGPFYHDIPDPEKSLSWFAYNSNKRGITLDIETADGQELFKRLVKGADFVIESFSPGYMDKLGLGYSALEGLNPGVIMVSITPFGQTGPYKDYKAPDIVALALGGRLYPYGDADRPPVRISHHSQAYLHVGHEAAVGAMMALYHRQMTGEGQYVEVSMQACVAQLYQYTANWDMNKVISRRGQRFLNLRMTRTWPCKDGYVIWSFSGAGGLRAKKANTPLVEWMESEGMGDDFLKGMDWEKFDLRSATQEVVDRIEEPTGKFFMLHTKVELYEGAVKRGLMLCVAATTADVLGSIQLAARGFWSEVEHPELGTTITSETPPRISRRAPLIGEHNQEVYEGELGLSREELLILKQARVI